MSVSKESLTQMENQLKEHCSFVRHLDMQINVLIGLSMAAILLIDKVNLNLNQPKPFMLFFTFPLLSLLLSITALHPPRLMRNKKKNSNRLLNNNFIASFSSPEAYADHMAKIFDQEERIFKEISIEIYTLINFYYRPKRRLFRWAQQFFIAGLLLVIAAIMVQAVLR